MQRRSSTRQEKKCPRESSPQAQAMEIFSKLSFIQSNNSVDEPDFDGMISHITKCFGAMMTLKEKWKHTHESKAKLLFDTLGLLWCSSNALENGSIRLDFDSRKSEGECLVVPRRRRKLLDAQIIEAEVAFEEIWLKTYWSAVIEGASESMCNDIIGFGSTEQIRGGSLRLTPAYLASARSDLNAIAMLKTLYRHYPQLAFVKDAYSNELPLHTAARSTTSLEVIQFLFNLNPAAALLCGKSGTPLHIMVNRSSDTENYKDLVRALIDAEPKAINVLDEDGDTSLHIACDFFSVPRNYDAIRQMVHKSPQSLKVQNESLELPLHKLCEMGLDGYDGTKYAETVKLFLEAFPEAAGVPESLGWYPLHVAASCASMEAMVMIYEAHPAAIRINVPECGTPLHQAAGSGDLDKMNFLYSRYPEAAKLPDPTHKRMAIHFAAEDSFAALHKIYSMYPEAIKMADIEGNLAISHLLSSSFCSTSDTFTEQSDEADRLRFLLNHYPEAAAIENIAQISPYRKCVSRQAPVFVRRLMLLACPHLAPGALKIMNYQARRQAMFVFFSAIPARRSERSKRKSLLSPSSSSPSSSSSSPSSSSSSSCSSSVPIWMLLRMHGDITLIRTIVGFL